MNRPNADATSLESAAAPYSDEGITVAEALGGAADILAEATAEKAELRAYLRDYLMVEGLFVSQIKKYPEGSTKYEMYRDFWVKLTKIAPHNLLALYRGEAEGILSLDISFDESVVMSYLESQEIHTNNSAVRQFYREMLRDAFQRLLKPTLIREVRSECKTWADQESIKTFEANLRNLLLSAPAGMKPTLAIDPGISDRLQGSRFIRNRAVFGISNNLSPFGQQQAC